MNCSNPNRAVGDDIQLYSFRFFRRLLDVGVALFSAIVVVAMTIIEVL
jgi:hypothetical protein